MQEVIDDIVEKSFTQKKELFSKLLSKCIYKSKSFATVDEFRFESVIFSVDKLFKGFSPFINELGKDTKYESGVAALSTILEELDIEVDKNECFMLFHMRDLGKFRINEAKLHHELKTLWKKYPHYYLEDIEFSYSLKNLMRKKLINYRRVSVYLNPSVLIHYRKEH